MFAFWDEEELGLVGSGAWINQNPAIVSNLVTYVNYDIQGANLLPSLANDTLAVGSESGGAALANAVTSAAATSTLDLSMFSLVFGQGRSDHARFVNASVPTVFFTDATAAATTARSTPTQFSTRTSSKNRQPSAWPWLPIWRRATQRRPSMARPRLPPLTMP